MIRVLIVDDDVPTRVGVRTILTLERDIDVVGEAATGLTACDLAAELRPDVVLMDVQLPDLDGIEATRRITAADVHGRTPPRVLVLTTFDVDEYVFRSLEAGASGLLLKRTRAEEIVEAVRAVAGGAALPMPALATSLISRFAGRAAGGSPDPMVELTARETDVLILLARGLSNKEIADELGVSIETVRTHVKRVYAKTGVRDRVHAVITAYETGLVGSTAPPEARTTPPG